MANFFENIHKVREMNKRAKEMQRSLESLVAEYENAGVKVVVSADMSLRSIEFTDKSVIDPAHPEKLVRTLVENVNKAFKTVKVRAEEVSREAMKSMDLKGLGDMLRGM